MPVQNADVAAIFEEVADLLAFDEAQERPDPTTPGDLRGWLEPDRRAQYEAGGRNCSPV